MERSRYNDSLLTSSTLVEVPNEVDHTKKRKSFDSNAQNEMFKF